MLQILGITSGILSVFCYAPYIRDILLKKTRPERASWLIWSALGGIAFFSQLAKGATDSLWLTGVQTLGVIIIFILSLKFGMGGLAKRDIISLLFAGVGIVTWYITKEAAAALFIVIAVDITGSILTMIKSYEDPGSETLITWILSGTSGLFGAFAVGNWNFVLLSYPLYIFVINFLIAGSIVLGKKKDDKVRKN